MQTTAGSDPAPISMNGFLFSCVRLQTVPFEGLRCTLAKTPRCRIRPLAALAHRALCAYTRRARHDACARNADMADGVLARRRSQNGFRSESSRFGVRHWASFGLNYVPVNARDDPDHRKSRSLGRADRALISACVTFAARSDMTSFPNTLLYQSASSLASSPGMARWHLPR